MLLYKQKKNQALKGNRFLISITVLGSPGPIRIVVNENELVAAVIDHALKLYEREGRLPVLGFDLNNCMLYSPIAGIEALLPWVTIGSFGVRNFFLCKKPQSELMMRKHCRCLRRELEGGYHGSINLSTLKYLLIETN